MNTDITTYILSGGKSSRFGSDKARSTHAGEPIISRLARIAHGLGTKVIVSSDTGARYADLNIAEIADIHPGHGPLSGLQSILTRAPTTKVLVMTCDMPLVSIRILQQVISEFSDTKLACVFGNEDRIFPFPGVYSKRILPQIEQRLKLSEFSICAMLNKLPIQIISTVPDEILFNMNTQNDYIKLNGETYEVNHSPHG